MADSDQEHGVTQGSFSVFVPNNDDDGSHLTFFRLGGEAPYLPDGSAAATEKDGEEYGIYMYTAGAKTEVVKGKSLTLSVLGDSLNTAEYKFTGVEDGLPHLTSWKRSSATSISLSDARSFTYGYSCSVGVSASQSIAAAASFNASTGVAVEAKCDPLSVSIKNGANLTVSSPGGEFQVNATQDIRGLAGASLTCAPHDVAHQAGIRAATIAFQTAIAAISAATGVMILVQTAKVPDEAVGDRVRNEDVRDELETLAQEGVAIASMVTLLQVAGIALGATALGLQKGAKALDMVASSQVSVGPAKAQMRVGPSSFIALTPVSITMNAPSIRVNGLDFFYMPALQPAPA